MELREEEERPQRVKRIVQHQRHVGYNPMEKAGIWGVGGGR